MIAARNEVVDGARLPYPGVPTFVRRTFQAEVAREVCQGNPHLTESTLGWGREAVRKGLAEAEHDVAILGVIRGHTRHIPS